MPYADPERKREYDRRRRADKGPELLRQKREYYVANREAIIAKVQARADPEAKKAYDRQRYLGRRDEVRRQAAEWEARNPEKLRAMVRAKNHRRRGARPDSTALEYMVVLTGDPCCYCGGMMEHVDHIDPISRGGRGEWENLTAACQRCNYAKSDKPLLFALANVRDRDESS